MRYVMRQKFLSWGDKFTIQNESGEDVYFVDGKALSFGAQLSFLDTQGNELAFIKQKLLSWGPTYEIDCRGELRAVVKKAHFTLFQCKFTVDVPGPDDLEAKGDFMHHEYTFLRGERVVAAASKQWFAWSDTYGVEVDEGEDDVLILAAVVVIDQACRHKRG